jgi:hypothetical protein
MKNDQSSENKRRFSRVPFDASLHLVSATGSWHSQLVDISLKGMLANQPADWQAKTGDHYLVELLVDNQDAVIRMEVSVVHIVEDLVGFRCENIDMDSAAHLRRLVELNLGDSTVLERELSELGR